MTILGGAADGHGALSLARQAAPDVVPLDVSMPGPGGVEVTRQVTQAVPGAHVLMLATREDAESR